MKFVDLVRVHVRAGRGGNGMIAWRREKYVPKGGPAGGDGGRGGDVVLVADPSLSTLLDLRFRPRIHADDGEPGGTRDKNGHGGEDLVVKVPVGTMVYVEAPEQAIADDDGIAVIDDETDEYDDDGEPASDEEDTGELLGDLSTAGQRLVVARGGRGGRGNIHFR